MSEDTPKRVCTHCEIAEPYHRATCPHLQIVGPEAKTLRDEFALAALIAVVPYHRSTMPTAKDDAAIEAYEYADAMLEARNEKP